MHMAWKHCVLALVLACAALGGGCSSDRVVIGYDQGGPASLREAPADGRYALKSGLLNMKEHHVIPLRRGDVIGFQKDNVAGLKAVAGDHEYTLTEADYVWKLD